MSNPKETKRFCLTPFKSKDGELKESHIIDAEKKGSQWKVLCPYTPQSTDNNPGLTIYEETESFHCFSCGLNGKAVEYNGTDESVQPKKTSSSRHIEKIYDYRLPNKELLYQVVRKIPKSFEQRREDGKGDWIWDIKGIPKILYHLPELLSSPPESTVFITEGEKDVETLEDLGLVATTNSGGKNGWKPELGQWLIGRDVVYIPDTDESGKEHSSLVIPSLLLWKVKRLTVIDLTPFNTKDITEWIETGHKLDELFDLIARTEPTIEFKGEKAEKPQSLFEILAEPEIVTNSIVNPIFQEGDKSILTATWKLGKTLLDTQAALCVSKPASNFLGFPVTQQRNVFYLRFELKKQRFKKRLHNMMNGMDHHFKSIPLFDLYRGFDLLNKECADWLYSVLDENEIGFLIMEPMYKMVSIPLNKPESAGPVLRALEQIQIRFPKIHISLAHHERRLPPGAKKGEVADDRGRVYGPMQFFADFDGQMFLTSDGNEDDPTFTLSFLSNDIDVQPIKMKRDKDSLLYYPVSDTLKNDVQEKLEIMWAILNSLGGESSQTAFSDACDAKGIHRKRFGILIENGIDRNMWVKMVVGNRGFFKYYKPLPREGWKQI